MSARDDLARLIFITDNANAKDPDAEWEEATCYPSKGGPSTHYAYAIADGLLAAGVTMPEVPVVTEGEPYPVVSPYPAVEGYAPGCTLPTCICHQPMRVCEEYLPDHNDAHCVRCGWIEPEHTAWQATR